MSNTGFKDKFIGFVDILGFKEMVQGAELGNGMPLPRLLKFVEHLGTARNQENLRKYGPTTCPDAERVQHDLDFVLTQISDCVVVSTEVSPAGVINLVSHCWGAVIQLLPEGVMCRGYITRGMIYHTDNQVVGTGYQKAIDREKQVAVFKRHAEDRGTPFVEVDASVRDYVREHGDSCVKEMFGRMVKEQDGNTALFPFKRLTHQFIVAGYGRTFDPEKELRANQNIRSMIGRLRGSVQALVDRSNSAAVQKAEHYIAALDAQLVACDETDEMITTLSSPALTVGKSPRT